MFLEIIITLTVIGFLLYLINTYIPMQSTMKTILNVFVSIAVVLWLLDYTGYWNIFPDISVRK